MDDAKNPPAAVLDLEYPVTWKNGDTVERLEFRRIKGKDIRLTEKLKKDEDRSQFLLSRLTGQPTALFDEMDGADLKTAAEIVEGFLESSRKTGGDGSESSPDT